MATRSPISDSGRKREVQDSSHERDHGGSSSVKARRYRRKLGVRLYDETHPSFKGPYGWNWFDDLDMLEEWHYATIQ